MIKAIDYRKSQSVKIRASVLFIFLILSFVGVAQNNVYINQYFKAIPAYAPSLNGANDFLDIRVGTRQQWVNLEESPRTYLVSANGILNAKKVNSHRLNSLHVNDLNPYVEKKVKIGLGGHIFDDYTGGMRQLEAMVSGAVHVPVNPTIYVSLGMSGGIYHSRIEKSNFFVLYPTNDQTYQNHLSNDYNNNQFKLTTSLSAHSDQFYISYSLANTLGKSAFENFTDGQTTFESFAHVILGGVMINLGSQVEVIPNVFVRYSDTLPVVIDSGIRLRYAQNPYIGIAYRNTNSIVAMMGLTLKDKLDIGYSYDVLGGNADISAQSHEIVLGLRLFNYGKYTPMW